MKNADYRKLNDGSHNSSTYHKKDGTPVRAILKRETHAELRNLDNARERGIVSEREYDEELDAFIAEQNARRRF